MANASRTQKGLGRGAGVDWNRGEGAVTTGACGSSVPRQQLRDGTEEVFDGATVGLPVVFQHKHTNLFFFPAPTIPPTPCVTWSVLVSRSTNTCHCSPLVGPWDPWRGAYGGWSWGECCFTRKPEPTCLKSSEPALHAVATAATSVLTPTPPPSPPLLPHCSSPSLSLWMM